MGMIAGERSARRVAHAAGVGRSTLRTAVAALAVASLVGFPACNRADGSGPAAAASPADTAPAEASASAGAAWRKPAADELRRRLSPLQFAVTQQDATEPAFRNEYWDDHAPGIYVDVVSGEPLFSSLDKFDSGTGWPSFTKPIADAAVKTRTDWKLVLPRKEVRSTVADSHLGHVFDDGPAPTGLRYCMNSAALRFVPADRLEAEGYGAYLPLFAKAGAQGGDAVAGSATRAAGAASPAAVPQENPPRPTPPER